MIYLFHVKAAKHETIRQEIDNYILKSKHKQTSDHTKVFIEACQYAFQNVFFNVCFSFIFANQCLLVLSLFPIRWQLKYLYWIYVSLLVFKYNI